MLFPISMSGSTSVRSDAAPDLDAVRRAVVFALEDAEPHYVSSDSDSIRFRAGPFRLVWSWNILVPISCGRIHFSAEHDRVIIRYHVTFTEILLLQLALLVILGVALRATGSDWPVIVGFFSVAFIALDYFGTWLRFPVLLQEAAEQAIRLQRAREVA